MTQPAVDILGLSSRRFVTTAAEHGVSRPDALALYREAFRTGHVTGRWLARPSPDVVDVQPDGVVRKFILRLADGLETESVVLPQSSRVGRTRHALCVSSQVGCALGCTFCETAQMGLLRNLDTAEIMTQWWAARFELGAPVDNVVFMGMGEPMDNLDAVLESIRILVDRNGPAVAPARIAVSTVGRVEGIERLASFVRERGFRRVRLAVSLNAPNDEIRSRIMPINRAVPMARLREAMRRWPAPPRLPILIEYVIIPGVNDASEHADELCRYLGDLPCTVNAIPYNPRRGSPWPAPSEKDVDRFVARLRARGRFVRRRRTLGRSVMGACGQLGNPALRRTRGRGGRDQASLSDPTPPLTVRGRPRPDASSKAPG